MQVWQRAELESLALRGSPPPRVIRSGAESSWMRKRRTRFEVVAGVESSFHAPPETWYERS